MSEEEKKVNEIKSEDAGQKPEAEDKKVEAKSEKASDLTPQASDSPKAKLDGTPRAPSKESKEAAAEQRKRQERPTGGPNKRGPGGPGGGKHGGNKRRRPDEQEQSEYTEKVVQVRRVTKVVKGGKKLSFRVSVIIGNEKGKVGVGVGKAAEVLIAIKKAISDAKKKLVDISTVGTTISHPVYGVAGGSKVLLKPAAEGTGIIAGGTARIVLELAGVGDILAKSQGSKSALNVARATIDALQQLRSFKEVAAIRGISVKEMLY